MHKLLNASTNITYLAPTGTNVSLSPYRLIKCDKYLLQVCEMLLESLLHL